VTGKKLAAMRAYDASHGVTIQHASRINALLAEHLAGAEARRPR
jgi:hypothetical protein